MPRYLFALLTLCAALPLTACSKSDTETKIKVEPAPAAHASTTVKVGSHEDWCEEHQVPESQCSLCNPALSAAFKATGDWCEEHGVPESHCRKCNPDLKIVRPAKAN
ncbi:MAG TPA: hypothetical protein VJV79_28630 [Polyangiaceae bacterium]|nr:hypothetical protein [Polyangiaceae bacterium]